METSIIIILLLAFLGMFSHAAGQAANTFRGSSENVRFLLFTASGIGYLAHIGFVIWGFFKFSWWVPVVAFIIPFVLMALVVRLSEKIWVRMLSIIAVPVLIGQLFYLYW